MRKRCSGRDFPYDSNAVDYVGRPPDRRCRSSNGFAWAAFPLRMPANARPLAHPRNYCCVGFCSAKVHSTAVCAVSRDKDDLMRLAVSIRIVRIVRTGGYGGAAPVKAVRPLTGPLHHTRRMDCEAMSGFARSDMRDPPSPRLRRTRCTVYSTEFESDGLTRDRPRIAAGVFFAVFFSLKRKRA